MPDEDDEEDEEDEEDPVVRGIWDGLIPVGPVSACAEFMEGWLTRFRRGRGVLRLYRRKSPS